MIRDAIDGKEYRERFDHTKVPPLEQKAGRGRLPAVTMQRFWRRRRSEMIISPREGGRNED